MPRRTICTAFLLLTSFALALQAQRGPRSDEGQPSARAGLNGRFEATAPAVGEPMPDLTVYDADGHELGLRELLLGHYSVLILGCLT